jgi:hypothetical protein
MEAHSEQGVVGSFETTSHCSIPSPFGQSQFYVPRKSFSQLEVPVSTEATPCLVFEVGF